MKSRQLVIKQETYNIIENISDKKIRYVIHLSDIHIRANTRTTEYRNVFNTLFKTLTKMKLNSTNSCIVVTGDTMHEQILTPESVNLLKDLFLLLSKIGDIFVIIGNHDINHNIKESLDSLTPTIGKSFQTTNRIHILNDDCVYRYNNIQFGVTTIFANSVTKAGFINNITNISLYHGTISGYTDNNGFNSTNNRYFKLSDFSPYYHYMMFGDIHKQQYLNQQQTAWYAGSLIQQNRGESLKEHGFMLLDIEEHISSFNQIPNRYGMITLTINEKGIIEEDIELPKYSNIKVICKTGNSKDISELYNKLEEMNIVITNKVEVMDVNSSLTLHTEKTTKNLIDIRDNESVLQTLLDHISDEAVKTELTPKLKHLTEKIKFDEDMACKKIQLLKLKMNNLIRYAGENTIDFTSLHDIILVSGACNIGKSSLLDAILIAIFGKSTRGSRKDYYHTGTDNYSTEIELDVNGKIYKIIRRVNKTSSTGKKEKNHKLFIYENNIEIGSTKENKLKIINSKICKRDDLLRYIMILQTDTQSILSMKPKDRLTEMCHAMRLEIFKQISDEATKQINIITRTVNEYRTNIKSYKKYGLDSYTINKVLEQKIINNTSNLNKIKTKLNNIANSIIQESCLLTESKTKIDILRNNNKLTTTDEDVKLIEELPKITEITEQLLLTKSNLEETQSLIEDINIKLQEFTNIDTDDLKQQFITRTNKETDRINNQITQLHTKTTSISLTELQQPIDYLTNKINTLNNTLQKPKPINKRTYTTYIAKTTLIKDINDKITALEKELNNHTSHLDTLQLQEYDKNCKYCVQNSSSYNIETIITKLRKTLSKLKTDLTKHTSYCNKNKDIITNYENNTKIEEHNITVQNEIIRLTTIIEISKLKQELHQIRELECIPYIQYNSLKNQLIKLLTQEKEQVNQINELEHNIQLVEELSSKKDIIQEISTLQHISLQYSQHIEKLSNKQQLLTKTSEVVEYDLRQCLVDKKQIEFFTKNITELEIDKIQYTKITELINKNNGILTNIFCKKVLPRLESIINQMISPELDMQISLELKKDEIYIYKKNTTITIDLNGGFMTHFLNVIFRCGMSQITNLVKSNIFIVDEVFDKSGEKEKKYVINLLDVLKNHFEKLLIITHDTSLKLEIDSQLKIISHGSYSKIQQ